MIDMRFSSRFQRLTVQRLNSFVCALMCFAFGCFLVSPSQACAAAPQPVLLLDGETFADASGSGHTVVVNGASSLDTNQSVFGASSIKFGGWGVTDYLSLVQSANWNFGSGNFTIDFWVRWNDVSLDYSQGAQILALRNVASNFGFQLNHYQGNWQFSYSANGTSFTHARWPDSISTDAWHHYAFVRNGNTLHLFKNGVSLGTRPIAGSIFNSTSPLRVGGDSMNGGGLNGWLDHLQITNGTALWTSNFTPDAPTWPPLGQLATQTTFAYTASFAWNIFGSDYLYKAPIGWGYMDPMVVVKGNDFYVPILIPCDDTSSATRKVYCLYISKNGSSLLSQSALRLGAGGGDTPLESFQPPSIFLNGNLLLVGYWYQDQNNVSSYALDGIDVTSPNPGWSRYATHKTTSGTFNYTGAAMGRDGTIYVAGALDTTSQKSLNLIRIQPPYTAFEGPQTVYSYSGTSYWSLYPHVVVTDTNEVHVLFNLYNGNICPSAGYAYTSYKVAAQYKGVWGQSFQGVWSDAPADTLAGPLTNGSNCNYHAARFPLDLLYSRPLGATFAIIRKEDQPTALPNATSPPSDIENYTQRFVLYRNGAIRSADLGAAFASIFPTSKDIDAMSMTQLADGTFVLFANSRSTLGSFGVVTTKDFVTFSPAQSIATNNFGAGHSILVGKSYKNTQSNVNRVVYYHSGRFNDNWVHLHNYHLQFMGGVKTLQ